MNQLAYSQDELMQEHDYAKPHEAGGYQLHGGFDPSGTYHSPRTLVRWPAVRAWLAQLDAKGVPLIDASTDLLSRNNYPNHAQQQFLLEHGLGNVFWNSLTITGIFEARGKALCEVTIPDFQSVIVEDVSDMCVGHLHKGLLYAHGADEGGDPARPNIGAHDAMWFAIRDLVFGAGAYPIPEVPETLSRPSEGPLFPQIAEGPAQMLELLLNLLMIEVRAESFFSFCCSILSDPSLFKAKRREAEQGVELVERIRTDEAIHTVSLQVALTEMRELTFKTKDGGTISGTDMFDPAWKIITAWHSDTQQDLARERAKQNLHDQIKTLQNGDQLVGKFDRLGD